MAAVPQCRIELFGGLRVHLGERAIARFPTQKVASLLAYLAYHPQSAHPRDILVDLLWPDSPPQAGRASLSQALSALRRQLEPPGSPAGSMLITSSATVGLNAEAFTTDVAEFERLLQRPRRAASRSERTQASAAGGGPLSRGAAAGFYEDWVLTEQRRLAALCFQAALELASQMERVGDLSQALEAARLAVRLDPSEEKAHRELMRLYAASGQSGAALQQYKECERLLAELLGAAPSAAARETGARD